VSNRVRGFGQLGLAGQERALAMLKAGTSQSAVAAILGVTKNTIAGIWRRHGRPATPEPTTLWTRCAALEARLAAVVAENDGIGRIPGSNEAPRR
jgi:transcriptional regulator with XRE-family HTH domain